MMLLHPVPFARPTLQPYCGAGSPFTNTESSFGFVFISKSSMGRGSDAFSALRAAVNSLFVGTVPSGISNAVPNAVNGRPPEEPFTWHRSHPGGLVAGKSVSTSPGIIRY